MSSSPATVLVADANSATLASTSRVLRAAGLSVLEASTGRQALELASKQVDLIVLDANFPDIDGCELCRQLRTRPETSRTPVIHLAATFAHDAGKLHGFDSGADGYLTHPVEPPVLEATVKAFLRLRQSEAARLKAEQEREQLLASERAARQEAERAKQLKDEFIAMLSHELRTPLHAIVGWSQLLKLGGLDPNETAEAVESIERNAKIQAQMIADLVDVSRITSGKLRLDVQPVNPEAIVETAVSAVLPAAAAKSIRIVKLLYPGVGTISADRSRLQQVVGNLLSNAVKFTPPGGKIEVRLQRFDSHLEIAVADNGQGIAAELLSHIFERSRPGTSASVHKQSGLGVGLAIARQLVEMHGGTIIATSDGVGKGAEFVVTLPQPPV